MRDKGNHRVDFDKEYKPFIDKFVQEVKNNKNIKAIKISLLFHGSKEKHLTMKEKELDYLMTALEQIDKDIVMYFENGACYAGHIVNNDDNSVEKDLHDYLKNIAKTGRKILYKDIQDKKNKHLLSQSGITDGDKDGYYCAKSINEYDYYQIDKEKLTTISKELKNNILYDSDSAHYAEENPDYYSKSS